MEQTSLSLLQHLQQSGGSDRWSRLVNLYEPLLRHWAKRYDAPAADADDLIQEVLLTVSQEVARFEHNGRVGAFRAWLRTIFVHRLRNYWRQRDRRPKPGGNTAFQQQLDALEDPASPLSELWNQEHDQFVARRLLADAKTAFTPQTWAAFERVTLGGEPAETVAEDLGLTLNAVFIAKSRVLQRLRQMADGLIDSASNFF